MVRVKKIIAFIGLLFFCAEVFSQSDAIDSLRKELLKNDSVSGKITNLVKLSGNYKTYNIDSSYAIAMRATKLAEKEKPGTYYYAISIEALAEAYYYKLNKIS